MMCEGMHDHFFCFTRTMVFLVYEVAIRTNLATHMALLENKLLAHMVYE